MPNSIFLSHSSQHAVQAQCIAEVLRTIGRPEYDVFVSEHIPRGARWLAHICEQLNASSAFLLPVLENSVDYSWCTFEAGIFAAASHAAGTERPLLVVHPPHVEVPKPLRDYMNLEMSSGEATCISQLLRALFPRDVLANAKDDAIELLKCFKPPDDESVTAFDKRIQLLFSKDQLRVLTDTEEISNDVVVRGDPSSLELFGFDPPVDSVAWATVLENLKPPSAERDHDVWLAWPQHLARVLKLATSLGTRRGERIADGLPAYYDPFQQQVYRPSLYERVRRADGGMDFHINFTQLPKELAAKPEGDMGVISDLLDLCRRFRWGILENKQFAILCEEMRESNAREWLESKAKLAMAFGNLTCDFLNRGLKPHEIPKAFPNTAERPDQKRVKQLLEHGTTIREKLVGAFRNNLSASFGEVFQEYRQLNKTLTILCLRNYLHHIEALDRKKARPGRKTVVSSLVL